MKLHILGCYSATPRILTNPTAQVLDINNYLFLIDCGEGTQVQLRKHKIKFFRIKHIFISHLHGDHVYGLVGVISTFKMLKREAPLTIYGPKGIKEFVTTQLRLSESWTDYPLHFKELSSKKSELIYEDEKVSVRTIPLQHRIYCNGFLFTEAPKDRKLNLNAVMNYNIDKAYYNSIKKGKDFTLKSGEVIENKVLTYNPEPSKTYAFCSDTKYDEAKIKLLQNVTAMYHESTFLESHEHLCDSTGHSTAKQAARIAKKANVGQLILGHYSTRYSNINLFLEEAKTIFEQSVLAEDGKCIEF